MTGEKKLKDFTEKNYQKTLTKVNDHIYHFLGYGISNAVAVLGETSVILIDALDSTGYGEELKQVFSGIRLRRLLLLRRKSLY